MSKANSPFIRPSDRKVSKGCDTGVSYYVNRKVYLQYVETDRDDAGNSIGSVVPVVKETKTDIVKLVNSHAGEVGVKNMIMLFTRTGDLSLFNKRRSINSATGGFVDLTNVPSESASEIFEKLPVELKGNKSIESFLKTLTKEQFASFVKTIKDKYSDSNKGGQE